MSEQKNLMGLNLSVDSELMAAAAREAIIAGVASGLEMKEQLVTEFVKSMLSEQVRIEDGRTKQYNSDKCCSRLEYIIRKAFADIVREELSAMIEEQKPQFRELIRKEFQKKTTQSKFVEMFLDALARDIGNKYKTSVSVSFDSEKDY